MNMKLKFSFLGAVVDNVGDINHRHPVLVSWLLRPPNLLPLASSRVPLQNFISTSAATYQL